MIRLLLAAALLLVPIGARAQGYIRITSCGDARPPQGASAGYMDANGNICISGTGGGGGSVTQGTTPWVDNISQFGGSTVVTGTGASGAGIPRVTVSNDSTVGIVAGSAIIGQVGIDQTTDGSTNAVTLKPTATAGAGITPVVSASAEATHVLKGSAGNLYSVSATNLTSTPGFLAVLNATSAPADGAITPLACAPLPAGGAASIGYGNIPGAFSTGITAVVTSAATCFTKTTGVITAFISGVSK